MRAQESDDKDWIRTNHGTVLKEYEYLGDAADDIREAQDKGWTVLHVFIDGKRLEPTTESSGVEEFTAPRLIRVGQRLELRREPSIFNGRFRHLATAAEMVLCGGGNVSSDQVEVTYVR